MKLESLNLCLLMAGLTAASHGASSFTEDFSDGSTGPNMAIGSVYGADITSTSGGPTGVFSYGATDNSRIYLGTNDTDYGLQDVTFEADVKFNSLSSAWSMVFFGLGGRDAVAGSFGEPLTGAYLMGVIRPDESTAGPPPLAGNLQTRNSFGGGALAFSGIGLTPGSTHGIRMEWNAALSRATFLFDLNNDGAYDPLLTYTSIVGPTTFTASNSRLVIGGGNGLSFDNIVVIVPEPSAALLGGLGVLALLRRRRN